MRYLALVLILFVFSAFVCAIPIESMSAQEKRDFLFLTGDNGSNPLMLPKLMGNGFGDGKDNSIVPIFVTSSNPNNFSQLLAGRASVSRLFGGTAFAVNLPISLANDVLTSDSVSSFEIVRAQPLLIHSNPSLNTSTFYSHDLNGSNASICVVDSGIRETHEAFVGKSFENLDCNIYYNSPANEDLIGHGTIVAGIAFGNPLNNQAYRGVAFGATRIISAQFFNIYDWFGICLLVNMAACFAPEREYPADVSNNSWGNPNVNCYSGGYTSDGNSLMAHYADSIVSYYGKGMVFAAGNSGPGSPNYACVEDENSLSVPADSYNTISVGSINVNDTNSRSDDFVSTFSSRGPTADGRKKPDLVAPGEIITAPFIGTDSNYFASSGTSMSAPHVTGAVALLKSAFGLNWLESKAVLINSAKDINSIGWDKYSGWGYVDLNAAYYSAPNTVARAIDSNSKKWFETTLDTNDRITLVWNRFCDTNLVCYRLTNFDLNLYLADGTLVDSSSSLIDNVEQVVAPSSGDYLVEIGSDNLPFGAGSAFEDFAVASDKPLIDLNMNTKIVSISKESENAQKDKNFGFDVFVLNDTNSAQNFSLSLFKGAQQIGDIKTFDLNAFSSMGVWQWYEFGSVGENDLLFSLTVPGQDTNAADNNYPLILFVDGNNVSVSGVSLSPGIVYASKSDRNVFFDANIINLTGPAKDVNALLYYNEALSDSNNAIIDFNSSGIIRLRKSVPAGVYGDQNVVISISPSANEFSISDNNFSGVLRVYKIDYNIFSVAPSYSSGTKNIGDFIDFDVNVLNKSTLSKDINVLFYSNGIIKDYYDLYVGQNSSRIAYFSESFSDLNNSLSFIAVPDGNEYEPADNNYSFFYAVNDVKNAGIDNVSFSNILPYSGINRALINSEVTIGALLLNSGSGTAASDLNVRFYENSSFVSSKIIHSRPGDTNLVEFPYVFSTFGTHNVLISVDPMPNDSNPLDNNYLSVVYVDGNALRITGVSHDSDVLVGAAADVTVILDNLGPTISSTVSLRETGSSVNLDSTAISLNASSTKTYVLHMPAYSSAGTKYFKVLLGSINYDYDADNELFFITNIDSLNPNLPLNNVSTVGTDLNAQKHNVVEESNNELKDYSQAAMVSNSALSTLTSDENTSFARYGNQIRFKRFISNVSSWDNAGVKTDKTKVVLVASDPVSMISRVTLVEEIPKSIATSSDSIESSQSFRVRKNDPVIEFSANVDSNIVYYIKSKVSPARFNDFNKPAVVKVEFKGPINVPDLNQPVMPLDVNSSSNNDSNVTGGFDFNQILSGEGGLIIGAVIIGLVLIVGLLVLVFIRKSKPKLNAIPESAIPKIMPSSADSANNETSQNAAISSAAGKDSGLWGAKPSNSSPVSELKKSFSFEQGLVNEYLPALGNISVEDIIVINSGAIFSRTLRIQENSVKIILSIQRSLSSSGMKNVIIDKMPLGANVSQQNIDSSAGYRALCDELGVKFVEFTLKGDADIEYEIKGTPLINSPDQFYCPIFSRRE